MCSGDGVIDICGVFDCDVVVYGFGGGVFDFGDCQFCRIGLLFIDEKFQVFVYGCFLWD